MISKIINWIKSLFCSSCCGTNRKVTFESILNEEIKPSYKSGIEDNVTRAYKKMKVKNVRKNKRT